jgi:hypothetical protein
VATNAKCEIEMDILLAPPFSLLQGDNIIAKIQTQNVIGWSDFSLINSVQVAQIRT